VRSLAHEAGRLLDRLDRLDAILSGRVDVWAQIVVGEAGETTLVVDKLLDQARQHAIAYRQLVAELRAAGALKASGGEQQGGLIDELRRRREQREREAAGRADAKGS